MITTGIPYLAKVVLVNPSFGYCLIGCGCRFSSSWTESGRGRFGHRRKGQCGGILRHAFYGNGRVGFPKQLMEGKYYIPMLPNPGNSGTYLQWKQWSGGSNGKQVHPDNMGFGVRVEALRKLWSRLTGLTAIHSRYSATVAMSWYPRKRILSFLRRKVAGRSFCGAWTVAFECVLWTGYCRNGVNLSLARDG